MNRSRKRLVAIAAIALAVAAGRRAWRSWCARRSSRPTTITAYLPDRHRDLSRRRGPGGRRQGRQDRLHRARGHADEDDAEASTATCRSPPTPRPSSSRRTWSRPATSSSPRPTATATGPTMADGAVIPSRPHRGTGRVGRGQDPIDAAGNGSGPEDGARACPARRSRGSSTAPPTRWTATARSCARRWRNCPASARILADGSGNIVDIIKNLQIFVTALRDSKHPDRAVPEPAGDADQRARRQQVRSGRGADQSVGRDRRGAAIRRGHAQPDRRADPAAGQRHPDPGRQQDGAGERPAHRAERNRQRLQHLPPDTAASATGAFALPNFSNPIHFVCGAIGAVENTTAPETAKLCAQYLGPALRLLNVNVPPVPDQPVPEAGHQSRPR